MLNSQQTMEEAKALDQKIKAHVADLPEDQKTMTVLMIYAGILTETLFEYEEPDTVMEQSFHRIAELMGLNPADEISSLDKKPTAYDIDRNTELGRSYARDTADRLPGDMDDVHEIAIALLINDIPLFEKKGEDASEAFRFVIEFVITALVFEMAVQEFCDLVIEDFISEGWKIPTVLSTLSALSGRYLKQSTYSQGRNVEDEIPQMIAVMAEETARHGIPGTDEWFGLESANDFEDTKLGQKIDALQKMTEDFFETVDIDDLECKATALAKTAGRMVAVTSIDDGHMQGPVAKSLAKTGLYQGARL